MDEGALGGRREGFEQAQALDGHRHSQAASGCLQGRQSRAAVFQSWATESHESSSDTVSTAYACEIRSQQDFRSCSSAKGREAWTSFGAAKSGCRG